MSNWTGRQRTRLLITMAVLLVALLVLDVARAALLPVVLGSLLVYIMLPIINWLDAHMQPVIRRRGLARTLAVLIVYALFLALLVGSLAFVIPPIAAQVSRLVQGLPELASRAYSAAPEIVQLWLERYNEIVPENIRLALESSVQDRLRQLIEALQTGLFKTVSVLFSTVSFVLGLIIVPLWMFYILRDQPEIETALFRLLPPQYRDDGRSVRSLIDGVLGSHLRGQVILCLSVAIMSYAAFEIIDLDFALLLGTIVGIFEVIPVLGPVLGAIPAMAVALATVPSRLPAVVLIALAVQQIENNLVLPQVARGTVKLHPALVMIVLVVGGALGGFVGVFLSVPVTAIIRDVTYYVYLRASEEPLSPEEALARVRRKY